MLQLNVSRLKKKKKLVVSNSRGNEGISSNPGPICCCDLRELKGFLFIFLLIHVKRLEDWEPNHHHIYPFMNTLLINFAENRSLFLCYRKLIFLKRLVFCVLMVFRYERAQLGKTSLWILNPSLWSAIRHSELDAGTQVVLWAYLREFV